MRSLQKCDAVQKSAVMEKKLTKSVKMFQSRKQLCQI